MQVVLVGHDFGGACISYAMELFPSKVSKAIFIAATMLIDGQSALDMFTEVCFLSGLTLYHMIHMDSWHAKTELHLEKSACLFR